MSKELEALKRIVNEINLYKLHGLGDENWLGIQDVLKDVDILEQALTPPTEQEVCEEMEKYLNEPVWIDEFGHIRLTTQWAANKIYLKGGFIGVNLHVVLPPHLITLIGRFYEGKVKNND